MPHGVSPDKALEISLTGCARRHALEGTDPAVAIDELRLIAKGRADLLAEAAGLALGGYLAAPGTHHPRVLRAAALLVEAGADPRLVAQHTDATRERASRGHHSTATTGGPPNGE